MSVVFQSARPLRFWSRGSLWAQPVRARRRTGASKLRRAATVLLVALCAETIFSVPYRSLYLARHSSRLALIVALLVSISVLATFRLREPMLRRLSGVLRLAPAMTGRAWLAWCVGIGVVLRLAWTAIFHIRLKSDGLAYFTAARDLAERHTIQGAFWPPGFSLLLAPFFAVLGATAAVALLVSLLLFAATCVVTYRLAERLGGRDVARISAALVALWPCHVTLAGVNSKETLLAFLIPLAMWLYHRAIAGTDTGLSAFQPGWAAAAGVVTGFAALTQPAFLLFPAVIFLFEVLRRTTLAASAGRTLLFAGALLTTVLPWTVRNYTQFHRLVLISTNGGSVFYRANNPKANASYAAEGEEVLPADEFAADAEGYRAAKHWIVSHPLDFAVLMVRKQVVYLGDDGIGIYESMKRDLHPPAAAYALAKAVANAAWLLAWVLVLLGAPMLMRLPEWPLWFGLCVLPQVFQWAIDSVFESGSRHHLGYVPLVGVLVAMSLRTAQRRAASEADVTPDRVEGQVSLPISA